MFADEDHDDVELMLECTGTDILELIASDPKRYLNIVNNYNKTRDGRDIYLSDLFNIIITRNDNEYRIKFKTNDNGNWYEVGYSGGTYDEDDVHEAFSKKVQYAISRPVNSHRAAIMDTLQPSGAPVEQESFFDTTSAAPPSTVSTSGFMKPQGDQTKLTKIDRFMNRSSNSTPLTPSNLTPLTPSIPQKTVAFSNDIVFSGEATSSPQRSNTSPSVKTSMQTPKETHRSSALSELDILRTFCPDDRLSEYERLVSVLRSDDGFYQSLVDILPRLAGGQRILLANFLLN
jgi:hypothetical protein